MTDQTPSPSSAAAAAVAVAGPSSYPAAHASTSQLSEDEHSASDGELWEGLMEDEETFDWGGFREKRMELLKEEQERERIARTTTRGKYRELTVEKELIETSSKEDYCVIHFSHTDFRRCRIMDGHLATLAAKHPQTLFLKTDVSNAPWLVNKMSVKILPCLIAFVGGAAKDKILGFEDFALVASKPDDFPTSALELRLKSSGVLPAPGAPRPNALATGFNMSWTAFGAKGPSGIRSGSARKAGDSSDDDY